MYYASHPRDAKAQEDAEMEEEMSAYMAKLPISGHVSATESEFDA